MFKNDPDLVATRTWTATVAQLAAVIIAAHRLELPPAALAAVAVELDHDEDGQLLARLRAGPGVDKDDVRLMSAAMLYIHALRRADAQRRTLFANSASRKVLRPAVAGDDHAARDLERAPNVDHAAAGRVVALLAAVERLLTSSHRGTVLSLARFSWRETEPLRLDELARRLGRGCLAHSAAAAVWR